MVLVCLGTIGVLIYLCIIFLQGLLNDHINAIDFLMDQKNVVPRINPTILGAERRYIHFRSTPGNYFSQIETVIIIFLF